MTVEVYTSDDWRFVYTITEVRRHTRSLDDAFNTTTERLWMQTSEGPAGTIPKLQVVADFLSAEPTDFKAAHPKPHPRDLRLASARDRPRASARRGRAAPLERERRQRRDRHDRRRDEEHADEDPRRLAARPLLERLDDEPVVERPGSGATRG